MAKKIVEIPHKKWQYHLFTMMKERIGTTKIHQEIDELWRKYPNGLVAYAFSATARGKRGPFGATGINSSLKN